MLNVVATTPERRDAGVVRGCSLTMTVGGAGSWSMTVPAADAPRGVAAGSAVYVDGTDFGGIVDDVGSDSTGRTRLATYRGRSWTGILASKVLRPDAGLSHLTVSGDANAVLADLVGRMGLDGLFDVPSTPSGLAVDGHRFRYATGWLGICDMLAKASGADVGGRPELAWDGRRVRLSAVAAQDWSLREREAREARMRIVLAGNRVNHLVCLGGGEMEARTVIDLYADAHGEVSSTQTLFGLDERAEVYDYGSAESEEDLMARGVERLKALQAGDECDILDGSGRAYAVGDVVGGRDSLLGVYATARVDSKVAVIEHGRAAVSYRAGNPAVGVTAGVR